MTDFLCTIPVLQLKGSADARLLLASDAEKSKRFGHLELYMLCFIVFSVR